MSRPRRDELFMTIAHAFAARSTCPRAHVGAVIIKDKHIIAHGYNGAPAGMSQCDEVGCETREVLELKEGIDPGSAYMDHYETVELGCQRIVHAEANAVAYAAKVGVNCNEATIYTTHEPCRKCAELIVQAGIEVVVFEKPYRLGATDFLDRANVRVEHMIWDASEYTFRVG